MATCRLSSLLTHPTSPLLPSPLLPSPNTFQRIPDISFFDAEKKLQTLNGRLPPEDGSVRRETLGKRISDDSRHFIVRRPIKIFSFFSKHFRVDFFVQESAVLEELWLFGRDGQMPLDK